MLVDSRNVTAKIDVSKCLSLIFGKLNTCIFLSFIMSRFVATYGFAIIKGYLEGNAKIKISINFGFHIRQPLTTIANRKCGPRINVGIMDMWSHVTKPDVVNISHGESVISGRLFLIQWLRAGSSVSP